MTNIRITAASFVFSARFEDEAPPLTCAEFAAMLPCRQRIIHVRWSGEACWIPLGGLSLGIGYENAIPLLAKGLKTNFRVIDPCVFVADEVYPFIGTF